MGTKNNPGPFDHLAQAEPDEPIFTLRGCDPMAPMLVRMWAAQRWQEHADPEMVADARAVADAMTLWHKQHAGEE